MISVCADSNEQGSSRMTAFGQAVMADRRFDWQGFKSLDVDLCFDLPEDHGGNLYTHNKFLCELKEPADFVTSALAPMGHLYQQVLSMRESGYPGMVLVLGSDEDILAAIKESLVTRYHGQQLGYEIASYSDRLINFESNCAALGIPVYRWKASPWKRLLSLADKILTGGNLLSYAPKPANGERELAAAAMLFAGIGPKTLEPVLEDYKLCFVPRVDPARNPCDMPGIGKKRAAMIDERIVKIYGMC